MAGINILCRVEHHAAVSLPELAPVAQLSFQLKCERGALQPVQKARSYKVCFLIELPFDGFGDSFLGRVPVL